ncbi:YbaY family lipoprotein [Dyella sp. 2HG41-7]|uniref:YbaY family lipoprotein n=1 Tax=Dyella sp. 2HG41-7 TaxID=2883239 RepID=UPI001F2DBD31|nr:YbaY family lipoprotein [Dyella sp. 2HG41-7]
MKIRYGALMLSALLLAGCSWMPHFGKHAPAQAQTLMKSLSGEVDFRLAQEPPSDAYLEVTLSDVSKKDAPARVIATDRISPVGVSPVPFVLSYEPADLAGGVDFAVSARIKQGDRTLAANDTQVMVLGRSGNDGPVRVAIAELH